MSRGRIPVPLREQRPCVLRAIGHLFEAEAEPQAWPNLHEAIREARRTYQRTGKVLGFEAPAILVAKRRPGSLMG